MDWQYLDYQIKHYVFTWKIENFALCFPGEKYTAESPPFTFVSCEWFLKLRVEVTVEPEAEEIQVNFIVHLCRYSDDDSGEVGVRFLLSLMSTENVFNEVEREYVFKNGDSLEVMNFNTKWQTFWPDYTNENEDDILVIECDLISVLLTYCPPENPNSAVKMLSENLLALLHSRGSHNAHLVAEGKEIPVHKEILCARSSVFESIFPPYCSRIEVNFSQDVVEAMLIFIYSGNIDQILTPEHLPSPLLYRCAMEYEIHDLVKILAPWKKYAVSSVIESQKIKLEINIPQFTKRISKNDPFSKLSGDTEVIIYYGFQENGSVSFRVKFSTSKDVGAETISGIFYILDIDGGKRIRKQELLQIGRDKECCFHFEIEPSAIFTDPILSSNVLKMQCLFKLGYPNKSKSSSNSSDTDYLLWEEEYPKYSGMYNLSRDMEKLFDNHLYSNLQLISVYNGETNSILVHKSVLSARSPIFRDFLRGGDNYIEVEFPLDIAKQLMHYLYTGRLSTNLPADLPSLSRAANYYLIPLIIETNF